MTNESTARTPPYASYTSFDNFLAHLRDHPPLPPRIDKSVMSHLNYGTQQALIGSLRSLGLIDDENSPTDRLKKLVQAKENQRGILMLTAIKEAYPYFWSGFDLERATADQFTETIRKQGFKGSTIEKAISFFIAAASAAGAKLSPHLTKRKTTAKTTANGAVSSSGAKRTYTKRVKPKNPGRVKEDEPTEETMVNQLLEKFPNFDPKWDKEIQEKWFAGFGRLMDSAGLKEKKS